MEKKNRMTYVTCAVCGKRSRQPKMTAEQEYGWDVWFLDGMPKYSEKEKVLISETCPHCGYSNRTIAEDGIANLLDFKSEDYQNPMRVDEEMIKNLGITDLMDDVKACMRAAYLLKGSDVACYGIALEEYITAVWLLEMEMQAQRRTEIEEICSQVRTICLEHAIFCCNRMRKRVCTNEYTILLIELYRRRGLMDLAMAYIEELLENEMWNSLEEKLMLRHQMELCKEKNTRPATLFMGRSDETYGG